jgi:type I restriction enzyme M protein
MKTQEVPTELREFYGQFRKFQNKYDDATVFDDFLSAMMNYFTPSDFEGIDIQSFNKYSKEERLLLGELIRATVRIYHQQLNNGVLWYDPLGAFYEMLASSSKKSGLGQFFTPAPIVDFMTKLHGDNEDMTGKGLTVSDPSCGSGRFLIAFHANFPGNFAFGEDLDLICCKMACINMMVHGCEGEVVHHNALIPNDYQHGWSINKTIRSTGLPSIQPLKKEDSFVIRMWQSKLQQQEQESLLSLEKMRNEQRTKFGEQLDMFS